MPWKLIFFVVLVICVAVFVGANTANVCNISFVFTVLQNVPVYLTILLSFAAGMLIMLPFTLGRKKAKLSKADLKAIQKAAAGNAQNASTGASKESFPAESASDRKKRKKKEAAEKKAAEKAAASARKKQLKKVKSYKKQGVIILPESDENILVPEEPVREELPDPASNGQ